MQKGISIVDLAKKIEANRAMKSDMIVRADATQMIVHDDGQTALQVELDSRDRDLKESIEIGALATETVTAGS